MNRGLLVGINAYPGNELQGCINDVTDMADFLVSHCGFDEDEIRLLADGRATTSAILDRLNWLVDGAKAGDRLVFHYSGHGAQFPIRDPNGKVTRIDECICPVDFDWTEEHAIRDKEFHKIFSALHKGVDLTWVSDSCHSGDLARDFMPPKQKSKAMPMLLTFGGECEPPILPGRGAWDSSTYSRTSMLSWSPVVASSRPRPTPRSKAAITVR